jgi:hypothetical protein
VALIDGGVCVAGGLLDEDHDNEELVVLVVALAWCRLACLIWCKCVNVRWCQQMTKMTNIENLVKRMKCTQ